MTETGVATAHNAPVLTVLEPGASTTVQDAGRLGSVHYGVSPSGAVDQRALRLANARVGNRADAAVLESLLGGLSFRLDAGRWCSLIGARAAVHVDGARVVDADLFWVPAGVKVDIGFAERGLYAVLAVSGGLGAPRTLGSASTDTLSGIGPDRLAAGDSVQLGSEGERAGSAAPSPVIPANVALPADRAEIRFFWGPRDESFSAEDRALLLSTEWIISNDTNRVGARLDGARLGGGDGTLPSEGIVAGSIQIPPSGQPIVFLADRPVTGGYPVIGVIAETEQGLFAQARPGMRVRFRPIR